MYNAHRGMVPAPSSRLTELLDQVRAEFDNQQNRTAEYDQQSEFVSTEQVCQVFQALLRAEPLSEVLYLLLKPACNTFHLEHYTFQS